MANDGLELEPNWLRAGPGVSDSPPIDPLSGCCRAISQIDLLQKIPSSRRSNGGHDPALHTNADAVQTQDRCGEERHEDSHVQRNLEGEPTQNNTPPLDSCFSSQAWRYFFNTFAAFLGHVWPTSFVSGPHPSIGGATRQKTGVSLAGDLRSTPSGETSPSCPRQSGALVSIPSCDGIWGMNGAEEGVHCPSGLRDSNTDRTEDVCPSCMISGFGLNPRWVGPPRKGGQRKKRGGRKTARGSQNDGAWRYSAPDSWGLLAAAPDWNPSAVDGHCGWGNLNHVTGKHSNPLHSRQSERCYERAEEEFPRRAAGVANRYSGCARQNYSPPERATGQKLPTDSRDARMSSPSVCSERIPGARRIRFKLASIWPHKHLAKFDQIGPISAEFGRIRPDAGRAWPNLGRIWPNLAARSWPNLGRIWGYLSSSAPGVTFVHC